MNLKLGLLAFTLTSLTAHATRAPLLQCLGFAASDFPEMSEVVRVVEEDDPNAIVVTAAYKDACSASYLTSIFTGTPESNDFLAPVNTRRMGGDYAYTCPNGTIRHEDKDCRNLSNFNVLIGSGSETQSRIAPDGTGLILGFSDADVCAPARRTGSGLCGTGFSDQRETVRSQIVIPFGDIEDAAGKQVDLQCLPENCKGMVLRRRQPGVGDSLLTVTTLEDGTQKIRLVINGSGGSGINFTPTPQKTYRSCARRPHRH